MHRLMENMDRKNINNWLYDADLKIKCNNMFVQQLLTVFDSVTYRMVKY